MIKYGKTHLVKVSIRIRTDIGFSWLNVYTGNVVNKSTKMQLRWNDSIQHPGHFQP